MSEELEPELEATRVPELVLVLDVATGTETPPDAVLAAAVVDEAPEAPADIDACPAALLVDDEGLTAAAAIKGLTSVAC